MNLKKSTSTLAAIITALAAFGASQASAVHLPGTITFAGGADLDNNNLNVATQVVAGGFSNPTDPTVTSRSGVFSGVGVGSFATFATPYSFNSGAVAPFISFSGFVFNLTSSSITAQANGGLLVTGNGFVTDGMDQAAAIFRLSSQEPDAGGVFSFSASIASRGIPTNVPDGGATVALLGLSLLGLQGARRLVAKRNA